jgi:arylsulfatase A-like enzyme/cytochrome c-type biogenesis protein CcmH/NrfG
LGTRPLRLALALFLALSLALSAACRRPADPPIVVISIDTLRSDHLPAYGYSGLATPAIDALRRDAILYERAYSHVPLTLPSHTSLLSGRLPSEHGLRDNVGYTVDPVTEPWLPEMLRQRGYSTAGFVSSFVLRKETGLARGFDLYDDAFVRRPEATFADVGRSGAATYEAARPWLAARGATPFFLFFHIYEPHLPYTPPPPFSSIYRDRPYDGEIAEADRVVGLLIAELKRLGLYERSLVLVLSDHGEGLGDHGEDEHGLLLYRESLQVPLLIKLPDGERAGTSVASPVQLIDLVPTLADRLDLNLPAPIRGSSLLASLPDRALYAESYYAQIHFGWQPLHSLVAEGHQYIESSAPELYDLTTDSAERHNLLNEDRRRAGRLREQLRPLLQPLRAPATADETTRRDLAALGYLSGAAAPIVGDPSRLPRPQDRIGVLRAIAAAVRDLHHGEPQRGITALEAIVAENPLILDVWSELGVAETRRGGFDAALRAYERAFELSGRNPDLALPVVHAKLNLGQRDDAIALAIWAQRAGASDGAQMAALGRRLTAIGDRASAERLLREARLPEPLAALAELLATSGRAGQAVEFANQAILRSPRSADAYEQLALAELSLGGWAAARQAAQTAVDIDARRANAWNHLGVALYRLGDSAAAVSAWEKAVEIDPDLFDTLYNLGLKAAEQGRTERAIWALERFLSRAPKARYGADFPHVQQVLAELRQRPR